MANLLAATRIASRWLHMDVDTARARARELPEVDAVYVSDDQGQGVLIGKDLRPLFTEAGVSLTAYIADFVAGWRTDYWRAGLGPRAA